ncbi:hypothetical protein BD413DRAFT_569946 [Trametes elegans]|nr:hypothetical protein BD413DRAFT_569946 [Trametes elegans]
MESQPPLEHEEDPQPAALPELLTAPLEPSSTVEDDAAADAATSPEEPAQSHELRTATLDSQLTASMELPRAEPLVSPPAPVGEPEVPDPFMREPEDSSSEEASAPSDGEEDGPPPPAEEITLAPPPVPAPSTPSVPHSPNMNKSVPPTPVPAASDDDEDEEEVPELYLPGLTLPTMFLPIPNVRYPAFSSLTWWLSKDVVNYRPCTISRQTH